MYVDFHKWMDEWVDRWIGTHIMTRRHFEQPNKHESTGSLFFFNLLVIQLYSYTWLFSMYIYIYTPLYTILYTPLLL